MKAHDPIHALVVDARMTILDQATIQHRADPAVAVGPPGGLERLPDQGVQLIGGGRGRPLVV